MRTKTLLLSAVAMAAGLASSFAQSNVYSANVVGYVNRQLYANTNDAVAPTFAFVANHLDTGNNVFTNLLQSLPVNSKVLKWNPAGSSFNTFTRVALGAGWSPTGSGSNTLNLGEAALVKLNSGNATGFTNPFVGQVFQSTSGSITNVLLPGFTAVSLPVPLDGVGVTNALVGLNAALPPNPSGSKLQKWDEVGQAGYVTFTRTALGTGWSPSVPTVKAGEGFFIFNAAGTNRTWIINFTVQ
jgi:hypothetical protein